MARGSLESRLIALEQERDRALDRILDQYGRRECELLGDRLREFNDALGDGQAPAPELLAIVNADPEMQRLDRVYWQIERWRECVETTIPSAGRHRAT